MLPVLELQDKDYKRLGEAVICQAIRDANCIQWRDSAEMYIGSDECRHLCDLLGLEYQNLLTWLKGDRPSIDGRTGKPVKMTRRDSKRVSRSTGMGVASKGPQKPS